MRLGVKKMQTFEQYWARVHVTLDHRDIFRAAEQAWAVGYEAGFKLGLAAKSKDFNEQLRERFNDE